MDVPNLQCDIDAGVLRNPQDHAFGHVGPEASGRDRNVIASWRQRGSDVFPG